MRTYTFRSLGHLYVQNELIYSCVLDGLLRAVSGLLRFVSYAPTNTPTYTSVYIHTCPPPRSSLLTTVDPFKSPANLCAHRGQVDKRSLLEQLSSVLLSLDEVVDGGCVRWLGLALGLALALGLGLGLALRCVRWWPLCHVVLCFVIPNICRRGVFGGVICRRVQSFLVSLVMVMWCMQ